jgi:hypothetical protein
MPVSPNTSASIRIHQPDVSIEMEVLSGSYLMQNWQKENMNGSSWTIVQVASDETGEGKKSE